MCINLNNKRTLVGDCWFHSPLRNQQINDASHKNGEQREEKIRIEAKMIAPGGPTCDMGTTLSEEILIFISE